MLWSEEGKLSNIPPFGRWVSRRCIKWKNNRAATSLLVAANPMGYSTAVEDQPLITVIETPTYLRRATKLLSEAERAAIVDHLAANPTAGDLISGGGGVRKLRWAVQGRGKSGGVRVIHFFADGRFPVFLVDLFAKNEKANYSAAELATVRDIAKVLTESYTRRA